MAAMVGNAHLLSNERNDAGDVLPCPHFEGVEKRIEIDFHDGRLQRGTFQLSFPATERPRADPCPQALKPARNEINNVFDR